MATLREIRSRIRSVKSTQKITKAMKLVDAAKLRKAQDAVIRARPYATALEQMLSRIAGGEAVHPLLETRPVKKIEILVMTSDRGLAGGFNSNLMKALQKFIVEQGAKYAKITVSTIGRRGREYAKKRDIELRKDYPGLVGKLKYAAAQEIAGEMTDLFVKGEVDAVFILYSRFQSALVQAPGLVQLLPIVPGVAKDEGVKGVNNDFTYEPAQRDVLAALLPKHIATQVWRALLENAASEHGARMTAMDSATKNAKEMIAKYTLKYNRARQAAITKELMEIVSGSEALK